MISLDDLTPNNLGLINVIAYASYSDQELEEIKESGELAQYAYYNEVPVGLVICKPLQPVNSKSPTGLLVDKLCVLPAYRGKYGLEDKLLEYVENVARKRHLDKIYVVTEEPSQWQKFGFSYEDASQELYRNLNLSSRATTSIELPNITKMVDYANWLKSVSDDTNIGRLSIPGTHNSAACHTALPSVQCQGASVTKQLEHGVRFLDVRLSRNFITTHNDDEHRNDLIVIHGNFPVKLLGSVKFSELLDEVYKFVDKHPSEFVILSIKQEGTGTWDNQNDEFTNVINDRFISKNRDKWYLRSELPTLRDCRGKIVLFRRFGVQDGEKQGYFGIPASSWSYNTTDDDRGCIRVQDFCEIKTEQDIPKKAEYVKNMINIAKSYNSSNSDPKLFVNFCSGSNFFDRDCWPEKVTEGLMGASLDECYGNGCGTVILDYSEKDDWKLVKKLVDQNF
ncbi:hypothetical protein KL937_001230 [Ogataea polymorpha]|nr:hypothetical protein KL937_001230 [Ogataea polymorpha]KAG7938697.1 hypothetical protein KL904_001226 [Ogataea polymorpha]